MGHFGCAVFHPDKGFSFKEGVELVFWSGGAQNPGIGVGVQGAQRFACFLSGVGQ